MIIRLRNDYWGSVWTALDRRVRRASCRAVILIPAVMSSLDDGDGGFRSGHIMLDADEMRMRDVRSVIMYSGDVAVRLDVQGLRMRGWNGGMLGDVEHMMILL